MASYSSDLSSLHNIDDPVLGSGIEEPIPVVVNEYPVRRDLAQGHEHVPTIVARADDPLREATMHMTPCHRCLAYGDAAGMLNLITPAGTICMFLASTALTGTAPPSKLLDVCAIIGVIGTLFAGTAALLASSDARRGALLLLMLSSACAAAGAIFLVAGTQPWPATAFTGACVTVMLLCVLRFAVKKDGLEVVRDELPRFREKRGLV